MPNQSINNDAFDNSATVVFVPDAHAVGMIGVIRSLGSIGYDVWAGSSTVNALGLRSRAANNRVIYPDYCDHGFVSWLRDFIDRNSVDLIIPSEAFLLAIRPCFDEFRKFLPLVPAEDVLYRAFSKASVVDELRDEKGDSDHSGIPPSAIYTGMDGAPKVSDFDGLTLPVFVKADGVDSFSSSTGVVRPAYSADEAAHLVGELLSEYEKVVAEGFVAGVGVGVYFLMHEGSVVAEFMNRCIHEVPHTGGFCSLRETWFHKGIRDDALIKARRLRWSGAIMLEYKWDPRSGRFFFIEVNARFWAALHLSLFAGIDFPGLLLDLERNTQLASRTAEPKYVRARISFPYEVGYVRSLIKDPQVAKTRKVWAVVEYFLLLLNPKVKDDLWYVNDRMLFFYSFIEFAKDVLRSVGRRINRRRNR